VPLDAINVTPPEAPTVTLVAAVPVSAESVLMDACVQFASEWGGTKFERAVEIVTGMVAKRPIEPVHVHFTKVAKLHRSGPQKLQLVEQAIAKEVSALNSAQSDLFAATISPSPSATPLGVTSPPAGGALPPTATLFDLAALRQCAGQIATWRPQYDAATAQRIATQWMNEAGAKRLTLLFATAAPRKRSGAWKFEWVENHVAHPRPLRPARRQVRGAS
jgi:hypothetical protein